MLSDAIRRWNPWWVERGLLDEIAGVKREKTEEVASSLSTGLIKGIIGPRRSGKTTLLYQIIEHLIRQGTPAKNILMLNFDDNSIYAADLERLLSECRKINPGITHIFLDEVQERPGWERWVRTLYDTRQFSQIFVTGSSSSLLKEDVSRVLTGRHLTFHVLPFSFREYLTFSGWDDLRWEHVEARKGEMLHHLHEYMRIGGYPEAIKMDDMNRNRYLNEMFDDVIARDITARYGADYSIARRIAYYVTSNASSTMTRRSIAHACGVAVDTVSKYLGYFHESGLIYPLRPFSFKLREQMREVNKYYSVDTGLATAVSFKFTENRGRTMENLVYLELLRRSQRRRDVEIYYWKDGTGKEIDFIVKRGMNITHLIQVCWDIEEKRTKKREISALLKGMNEFSLHEGTIITENHEDEETVEGRKIRYIPLWKWLLEK
ncbi:MAG: ATP-binding protein, partial [Thermoplasmata archaeon]|nr:ATP-binding protein [Thermoplasmata archaeon]